MTDDVNKPLKIEFMPGAFDSFEGTQEELNELMASLNQMVADGSIFEKSEPLDMDLLAEEDPELFELLSERLADLDSEAVSGRNTKLN